MDICLQFEMFNVIFKLVSVCDFFFFFVNCLFLMFIGLIIRIPIWILCNIYDLKKNLKINFVLNNGSTIGGMTLINYIVFFLVIQICNI